jgi:hypothetical protein
MRSIAIALLVFFIVQTTIAWAEPPRASAPNWSGWVYKVEIQRADGTTELGSAVSIAPERAISNCHVVRNASRIVLSHGGQRWTARPDIGDVYRDLCFLDVPGLPATIPTIAPPDALKIGMAVVAVGYSGGTYRISPGVIKGLFSCACDGGQVIQTSAAFEPGASGGGLFDEQGRLLGILTFKSVSGGNFHFAVPVSWMQRLNRPMPDNAGGQQTFWESDSGESGHFLAACDLLARKDWRAMLNLAQDWTRQEPADPQSWMALGRAQLGLERPEEAVRSFQHVLSLDSTHAEAHWELQKLEIDLGRTLAGAQ